MPQGRNYKKSRFTRFLDDIRDKPIEWDLRPYYELLNEIENRSIQLGLADKADSFLTQTAKELRSTAAKEPRSRDLMITGFALTKEAFYRATSMRYFDVQMVAGMALERGRVIEMETGEGKTMTAVLPAFTRALTGKGVHILTFNDYLAKRDAEWMGPVYNLLGLTVGHIVDGMDLETRRSAYRSDVTYLTMRELGYDILKQSLKRDESGIFMRPFHFAIVDEADSIMIDEARVPLVIAGVDDSYNEHGRIEIDVLAKSLEKGIHYQADENSRNVFLTDDGHRRIQSTLSCGDLQSSANRELFTKINQALHANELLKLNVDYLVRGGEIEIIDENTGRVVKNRHWPDGLHRAVEAKEGLKIEKQGRILGSISVQHILRLYPAHAGMTGTVSPSEEEFFDLIGLKTTVIPPNKPCKRVDLPDLLFTKKEAKMRAVVEEISKANKIGRPVLVGTVSIEESNNLAGDLLKKGISCRVLNAANDQEEAAIVAEAGCIGAVTVSTNMAGRGTDIKLGGADERQRDKVVEAGGLYVIGTNRFESRRIDDQLRGRSGRQGDPGESRFFVSMEDDLMERFNLKEWIPKSRMPKSENLPVSDRFIHKKIALVQRIVEGQNLDIRRTLYNYTSFVDNQRLKTQANRTDVLLSKSSSNLETLCPEKYKAVKSEIEQDVLMDVERQIYLFHSDRHWADHLARLADIREGIHLMRLGGKDPLYEFHKAASESYAKMKDDLKAGITASFESAKISKNGLDLDKEGLRGPTSTWTYLINDNPFDWLVDISGLGNVGLGIGAGLWGGLFVLKATIEKLRSHFQRKE